MNVSKFKQMQNTSNNEFKVRTATYDKNSIQSQKIEYLRAEPGKKNKHTINGLQNSILADFLELGLELEKSQPQTLKFLIDEYKKSR